MCSHAREIWVSDEQRHKFLGSPRRVPHIVSASPGGYLKQATTSMPGDT